MKPISDFYFLFVFFSRLFLCVFSEISPDQPPSPHAFCLIDRPVTLFYYLPASVTRQPAFALLIPLQIPSQDVHE